MAMLDLKGLLEGNVYKINYTDGNGTEKTLYAYKDPEGVIRYTRNPELRDGGKNLNSALMVSDEWELFNGYQLTEWGKSLLIDEVCYFYDKNNPKCKRFVQALHKEGVTWLSGRSILDDMNIDKSYHVFNVGHYKNCRISWSRPEHARLQGYIMIDIDKNIDKLVRLCH